jgi:hypothetical protein
LLLDVDDPSDFDLPADLRPSGRRYRRCPALAPNRAHVADMPWLRTPAPLIFSFGMRRHASRSSLTGMRGTRSALLVVLAALMTLPAFALASHKSPPRIPVCSALPRSAIASLVGTGPLALTKKIGNLCAFTGERHGHYKPALTIQIVPWSKSLFSLAEGDAVHSAAREHEQFGVVSRALKVGTRAFFVTGTKTSALLPPCGSEEAPAPAPLEVRTGPICAGEPSLTHITVIGYGPSPSGVELMVSAGRSDR